MSAPRTNGDSTAVVHGDMPVTNLYTAGIALETFLRTIQRDGRLTATRCNPCRLTYLPPRLFCERCLGRMTQWQDIPPTGTVHTWTVSRRDLDGAPVARPVVTGFVTFAGVTGGLVHRILADPEAVRFGLEVSPVFLPPGARSGSILDLEGFRPVG